MIERFEQLTLGVSRIYKNIQKIKKQSMESFGLKSTHVMCLHYLSLYPDGLSAAELCRKCEENKAGISRILTDLEHRSLIQYLPSSGRQKIPKSRCTHGRGASTVAPDQSADSSGGGSGQSGNQ